MPGQDQTHSGLGLAHGKPARQPSTPCALCPLCTVVPTLVPWTVLSIKTPARGRQGCQHQGNRRPNLCSAYENTHNPNFALNQKHPPKQKDTSLPPAQARTLLPREGFFLVWCWGPLWALVPESPGFEGACGGQSLRRAERLARWVVGTPTKCPRQGPAPTPASSTRHSQTFSSGSISSPLMQGPWPWTGASWRHLRAWGGGWGP